MGKSTINGPFYVNSYVSLPEGKYPLYLGDYQNQFAATNKKVALNLQNWHFTRQNYALFTM